MELVLDGLQIKYYENKNFIEIIILLIMTNSIAQSKHSDRYYDDGEYSLLSGVKAI